MDDLLAESAEQFFTLLEELFEVGYTLCECGPSVWLMVPMCVGEDVRYYL